MEDVSGEEMDDRILQYSSEAGLTLQDDLRHFEVSFFKAFTFLPDMAMHFGSFITKNNFTRETSTSLIENGICFLFYNIFEDSPP